MKFPLLLLAPLLLALPACTHTAVPSRPGGTGTRIEPHNPRSITPPRRGGHAIQNWTRNDVNGLTISLIDPKVRETYRFSGNGFATASYGDRNAPTTPLKWRINHGILEISDPTRGDRNEQLRLIEKTPTRITAINRKGDTVVYEILPPARK